MQPRASATPSTDRDQRPHRAMRAVPQPCSRDGRQIPAVTRSAPQSQPKLQAILRMALNGCALTCGAVVGGSDPADGRHGRGERDRQRVVALAQRAAQVEAVAAVLVAVRAELDAVEFDRRQPCRGRRRRDRAVGAVPEVRRATGEGGFVSPVDVADPRQFFLVLVEVRVGDQARGEQVEVHASRARSPARRRPTTLVGRSPPTARSVQSSCNVRSMWLNSFGDSALPNVSFTRRRCSFDGAAAS